MAIGPAVARRETRGESLDSEGAESYLFNGSCFAVPAKGCWGLRPPVLESTLLTLLLCAIVLGVVEGLTEFLPVSSTGHLILAADLLQFNDVIGSDLAHAFEIFIQLGAILAVVAAYPHRFRALCDFRRQGFAGLRGLVLLGLTTIPASLVGLAVHNHIETRLFNPTTVAVGLAVGAVWIILVERLLRQGSTDDMDRLGPLAALKIGLFQCLALWPGMSRSTSTILGGMMSGLSRRVATEYSFLSAVPVIVLAAGYSLVRSAPHLSGDQALAFLVGFVVSFVVALVTIKAFMAFLQRYTLETFGWYRLLVAAVVLGRLAW